MAMFSVALFFLILSVWWWFFFVCLLFVLSVIIYWLSLWTPTLYHLTFLWLIFLMSKMELSHLFPRFLMRVKWGDSLRTKLYAWYLVSAQWLLLPNIYWGPKCTRYANWLLSLISTSLLCSFWRQFLEGIGSWEIHSLINFGLFF